MKSLNRDKLRQLIIQEIESIGEDIVLPRDLKSKSTPPLGSNQRTHKKGCSMHGTMYEADCDECSSMYEEEQKSLNEGDCGCSSGCSSCSSDYPVPDDIDYSGIMNSLLGLHSHSGNISKSKNHHSGAYMAKSQMYKVSKYAQKLYHMIPDGHNLEDWMRTKLAQISDDISEVYHALEHDIHEGDV